MSDGTVVISLTFRQRRTLQRLGALRASRYYLGDKYLNVKIYGAPFMPDRAAVALAQWRKERPDLDSFPMAVLGRIAEAALIIARDRLDPLFQRFGLQAGAFDVLATLRRSGAPFALTPTALYEATMVSSGGMTNRIDRLEQAGLVERRAHPTDRRGALIALTHKGLTLIDEAVGAHVENERAILASLTGKEQQDLDKLLARLLAGLGPEQAGRSAQSGAKREPIATRRPAKRPAVR
jgi:DNA-binding MarR family transcriptional regulator